MRIRGTKPEFWRSKRVASVDWDARLVLKGVESYVDDNGVGKDDLALIVADVFPRDLSRNPPGTLQKVSEALDHLSAAGLLHRYNADGNDLLYVAFWEKIQRIEKPARGRFPRPDGTTNYRDSEIGASVPEPSRNPPGTLQPGTGEQGNRGTGDKPPSASASAERDAGFDYWWSLYPRKRDKGHALKAWRTARKKASAEEITEGLQRQLPELTAREPDKRPYPATWLNGERWSDAPDETEQPKRSRIPHVSELVPAPSGMTDAEYQRWDRERRAARAAQ